ncbi:VOC family protein [Legionella oakridgensis]|uniref:Glyoxylase n=2 Tax=Legionella oakridgensis TaxID=29423 RepID=A0A0W0X0D8_9GAMM|nr:VOC family protein [Legionella oakridgensis]AHE67247.1 putative enzyme related to lactoylglutathione lyase [Legionella oakridgensis ATCC 33761 = DSM 21215]ETO93207.1 hypothetical protein LOR_48c09390 [Legionella oakridgensis RV-2-2007]KTD37958.1 glyoxylase [Legionella oakridgensis]STY20321.1 glycoxylase [Legionella longbeachae]
MSNGPKIGEFCWNELATPNVKAAKEFYGNAFGWKFSDHSMNGSTYTMIKSGEKEFAGIWEIPQDQSKQIPPHWMSYILVDNLENSLKKVQEHRATIKVPTTKVGEFGQFAIITDPTGAHVALWETFNK